MGDVFSSAPGAVVAVDGPGIPMRVLVEGWEGYGGFKSIITGVRLQTENGVQFLSTLRDFIYVYTFGERIGTMTLSGVCFAALCEEGEIQLHGLEYAYGYYLTARASNLTRPIAVVLGGRTVLFAFVVGMTVELADAEHTLATFALELKVVPLPNHLAEGNLPEEE